MNKHNWKGIKFLAKKDDWKKIEKGNVTAVLLVFKNIIQILENKLLFQWSQMERDGINWSKKLSNVIMKNNIQTSRWCLFFRLPSRFWEESKLTSHRDACENKYFLNVNENENA